MRRRLRKASVNGFKDCPFGVHAMEAAVNWAQAGAPRNRARNRTSTIIADDKHSRLTRYHFDFSPLLPRKFSSPNHVFLRVEVNPA